MNNASEEIMKTLQIRILLLSVSMLLLFAVKASAQGVIVPGPCQRCPDQPRQALLRSLPIKSIKIDTKIVRIFNTYGPRMRLRDGRVVPAFIGQALSGTPLTVFGDGSQTRSFCYVSDLIDGIFRLAMSDFHEPVNIGNPREMTIKQFAEQIIRITGAKSTIEYKPLPEDDPKVRQPDITRAKKIIGWEPRVQFEEGIAKTIEYFRESLQGEAKKG